MLLKGKRDKNLKSGILLALSSLPSKYGIGSLGDEAYKFVDFLKPIFNTEHGVSIENVFENQKMGFSMRIDNPNLTGRILVSAMRAAFLKNPGAYFMSEIPPCHFCEGGWEKLI